MTGPAVPSRALPWPWDTCDVSSRAAAGLPGLPGFETQPMSPGWAARHVLRDAAQGQLVHLAGPTVGAWASFWTAAGLPLGDLRGIVDTLAGGWMNEPAKAQHQEAHLRRLRRAYPVPQVCRSHPERAPVDLDDLPMLAQVHAPDTGRPWPHFTDEQGRGVTVAAGADALILSLPDGTRAVLYMGTGGRVEDRPKGPGFRVPARLWPAVQAALRGHHGLLPTVQDVTTQGEQVRLTCDLAGHPCAYSLSVGTPYSVESHEDDPEHVPESTYRVLIRTYPDGAPAIDLHVPAHLWPVFRAALPGGKPFRRDHL